MLTKKSNGKRLLISILKQSNLMERMQHITVTGLQLFWNFEVIYKAEADCSTAINLDKKNVKAYLRRGTAREMLGYYKEAIEDVKHALVLEPTNNMANNAANRLKKLF